MNSVFRFGKYKSPFLANIVFVLGILINGIISFFTATIFSTKSLEIPLTKMTDNNIMKTILVDNMPMAVTVGIVVFLVLGFIWYFICNAIYVSLKDIKTINPQK